MNSPLEIGAALQQALYQRLGGELSVPVYDHVPMGTAYPYVTIDRTLSKNITPLQGRERSVRLVYLSVWSNYSGQAEVLRILGELYRALNERPLPLTAGRAVSVRVEQQDTSREPDGVTYQGATTVRVITTH